MSQKDEKTDFTIECSRVFDRMRVALRAESKHERDIVRIDLDSLEESINQSSESDPGHSIAAFDTLLSRLRFLRQEVQRLYVAREPILAELSGLEKLLFNRFVPVEGIKSVTVTSVRSSEIQTKGDKMYKYFLSYSRSNAAEADHLESLLHRQARTVLRDEVHFEAGRDLNEAAAERIRSANTFVALWSKEYKRSSWCLGELSYFRDLADRSTVALRLVLVELDDEDILPRFANVLRLPGGDRVRRELAVAKMVAEE